MNPDVLHDLQRRVRDLERTSLRFRQGEITDTSPLSVSLGGDTATEAAQLETAGALAVDDVVAALAFSGQLLILGRMTTPEAWTAYTPTVAGGSLTGSANTLTGAYQRLGRTIVCRGSITLGSGGGVSGGPVNVSLPVAAANAYQYGVAIGFDSDAASYGLGLLEVAPNASAGTPRLDPGGSAGIQGVGGTNPWTWASGDVLRWQITYEAAA